MRFWWQGVALVGGERGVLKQRERVRSFWWWMRSEMCHISKFTSAVPHVPSAGTLIWALKEGEMQWYSEWLVGFTPLLQSSQMGRVWGTRSSSSTGYARWETGREGGARMDGGTADKVFFYFPSQAISELRHLHRNEKTPVHTKQNLGCTDDTDFGEMNRILRSQESVF